MRKLSYTLEARHYQDIVNNKSKARYYRVPKQEYNVNRFKNTFIELIYIADYKSAMNQN